MSENPYENIRLALGRYEQAMLETQRLMRDGFKDIIEELEKLTNDRR